MSDMKVTTRIYDPKEEFWNVLTHGMGLFFSIAGLTLLVVFASLYESVWHIVSYSIYGASMVILYMASTMYHAAKKPTLKIRLNVFDHAAIYVLIAGTYTPLMLVTLRGPWGWSIFGIEWGLAITGIILKLFFAGRYDKISTLAYVLMGWLAIVAIYPLIVNLALGGLIWLLIGGIFYSIGAVFYLWHKLNYNHAIFHVFVLLGTLSHFICIFFYV
jgi:hemolysin III